MAPFSRIVLTRQQESNQAWASRLEAAGYRVLDLPLLRFEPIPVPYDFTMLEFDWIIFTSPQGVRAFSDAGLQPGEARIATLGGGTRTILTEYGWTDNLDANCLDGAELAGVFIDRVKAPAHVVLPGPMRRLANPRQTLEKAGFTVSELPLYETMSISPASLPKAPFANGDAVFFCSPSTIRAFAAAWQERPFCVSIGETTAVVARELGFNTVVAATPDIEAMIEALSEEKIDPMIQAPGLDPLSGNKKPEIKS